MAGVYRKEKAKEEKQANYKDLTLKQQGLKWMIEMLRTQCPMYLNLKQAYQGHVIKFKVDYAPLYDPSFTS